MSSAPSPSTSPCADLLRQGDWRALGLGSLPDWPPALRVALDLVLASSHPMAILCGMERHIFYNDACARLCGDRHPEGFGQPLASHWPEADQAVRAALTAPGSARLALALASGAPPLPFALSPIKGGAHLLVATLPDAQAALHERAHAMKNQLAMVQAIATLSLRHARDLDGARQALNARILVLSNAHDGQTSDGGHSSIRTLLERAIARHDDARQQRFVLSGPDVAIGARPAASLALMLHELVANAAQHGALSAPGGRVHITWAVAGDPPAFTLHWTEAGGPAIVPDASQRGGLRLIRAGLAGTSSSRVAVEFAPEGLRCTLSCDAGELARG